MGVPGLWDLLRPAATRTSLSTLAREAFTANKNGLRALTIGIDASIWIFHAQIPQYGENPFMRTIFFKITSLLQQPVLPVFVFDGPNKPSRKRGERVAGQFGTTDYRSRQFKELLDACGLEWWNAPGEAEAELAVMSRQGKIDAVLSDDVDALLFGATCLLRNNSPTLSGAQASTTQSNSAKSDLRTYEVYRSSAIVKEWTSREGTSLKTEEDCRMAMVWIALLGGGDYAPEGLPGFGPTITYALANAGLASFLHNHKSGSVVNTADAARVHAQMIEELQTNASGHLGRRYKDRASKLSSADPSSLFPTFALDAYLRPSTSPLHDPTVGWPGFGKGESVYQKRGKARNEGRGDLVGFAKACERFFEWGTKDLVAKKFASESVGLFGSELVNCARERVRLRDPPPSLSASPKNIDGDSVDTAVRSSSSPVSRITSFFQSSSARAPAGRTSFARLPAQVIKIHSVRQNPTNPEQSEYRVSFSTTDYIERCHDAMDGHRVDPKELDVDARAELGLVDKDDAPSSYQAPEPAATQAAPKSEARVWITEYLVREGWPELVEAYEAELAAKAKSKSKAKKPAKKTNAGGENSEVFKSFFLTQRPAVSQARSHSAASDGEDARQSHSPPSASTASSSLSPPPIFEAPLASQKKNARRAPPSSASSSSSAPAPMTSSQRSQSSYSTTVPASQPKKVVSPPRRSPRRSTRMKSKPAAKTVIPEIIDLCSSDEEVAARPVLAAIDRTNGPAGATKVTPLAKGSSKGKAKQRDSQTQTLLGLPVIRPVSTAVEQKSVDGISEEKGEVGGRTETSGKQKAPLYVVTFEDEERLELDVRGRWARGESVGL